MRTGRLRRGVVAITVLIIGGMALRAWLWLHFVGPAQAKATDDGTAYLQLLYYPTYARLDDLIGGVALAAARSYRTQAWAWLERNANIVLVTGVVLTALCMWIFNGQQRYGLAANIWGYPALAVAMTALVAGAASQRSILMRVQIPGASWFAAASYSLYLTHKMIYGQLHGRFSLWVDGRGFWTVLIYAAAVLVVGAILHYLVERPCLRLRDQLRRVWTRGEIHYATPTIS